MKIKVFFLMLGSVLFFACSQDQDKIVELPLTLQTSEDPFPDRPVGNPPNSGSEDNPWYKTYLKVSKFPEGLTDMKIGEIETNIHQSVYQNYLLGNITKERYEEVQKLWHWTPDTKNLSKTPLKTKIAFAYGEDSDGVLKIAVDANNNLDLSDDELFIPRKNYAVNVSYETVVHNKIVSVSVPLIMTYDIFRDIFFSDFPQYMTTQYEGKQIAVSSYSYLSYEDIRLAFMPEDVENGEGLEEEDLIYLMLQNINGKKLKEKDLYRKNEYVEINEKIYRILGVNTNKNVLVLEKTNLSETQLFSTQTGYRAYPFKGKDLTTNTNISLENLKGKYVFLDFWSEWCKPCIGEFPHLKELYAKTDRTKFEIVGIIGGGSFDGIKRLIEKHELTWAQIMSDNTNKIIETYGVHAYPTTILVDTEGVIIAKNLRGDELEEKVLSLMKE